MARSIVNQGLYLQLESVLGTAVTNAMKRYLSVKGAIGWDIQREYLAASGYKVDTAFITNAEMGTVNLEVIQDYNAMLPLLTGAFGKPTTTIVEASKEYSHKFVLDAKAAETVQTFTAIWGDATIALQATALAFHGITIGIQRQQLSMSVDGILQAPVSGTVPSAGVTEIPMIPMRASTYCAYIDPTWAALGTSKLLALYSADLSMGAKYSPDWVIDCAKPSYGGLVENENVDRSLNLQLGFDATAQTQIAEALSGSLKFVRLVAEGPKLSGAASNGNHKLQIDTSVLLTPRDTGRAVSNAAVVVNFDGRLMADPVSGKVCEVTLVNQLAGN